MNEMKWEVKRSITKNSWEQSFLLSSSLIALFIFFNSEPMQSDGPQSISISGSLSIFNITRTQEIFGKLIDFNCHFCKVVDTGNNYHKCLWCQSTYAKWWWVSLSIRASVLHTILNVTNSQDTFQIELILFLAGAIDTGNNYHFCQWLND